MVPRFVTFPAGALSQRRATGQATAAEVEAVALAPRSRAPVATTRAMTTTHVAVALRANAVRGIPVSASGATPMATLSYVACISVTTGTDWPDPLNANVISTLMATSWIVLMAMYASGASAFMDRAAQWNAPQMKPSTSEAASGLIRSCRFGRA